MKPKLTKKQTLFIEFIDYFIKTNGFSPSYREIADGLNYKSLATVAEHIENLILAGRLRKKDNSARSLEIITETKEKIDLKSQIKIIYHKLNFEEQRIVKKGLKILNIDELNEII